MEEGEEEEGEKGFAGLLLTGRQVVEGNGKNNATSENVENNRKGLFDWTQYW